MLILNYSSSAAVYEGYLGLDVIEKKKDNVGVTCVFPTSPVTSYDTAAEA